MSGTPGFRTTKENIRSKMLCLFCFAVWHVAQLYLPVPILDEMHMPSDVSLFYLRAALLTVPVCMFLPILVR